VITKSQVGLIRAVFVGVCVTAGVFGILILSDLVIGIWAIWNAGDWTYEQSIRQAEEEDFIYYQPPPKVDRTEKCAADGIAVRFLTRNLEPVQSRQQRTVIITEGELNCALHLVLPGQREPSPKVREAPNETTLGEIAIAISERFFHVYMSFGLEALGDSYVGTPRVSLGIDMAPTAQGKTWFLKPTGKSYGIRPCLVPGCSFSWIFGSDEREVRPLKSEKGYLGWLLDGYEFPSYVSSVSLGEKVLRLKMGR